jgi:hypothetical protein
MNWWTSSSKSRAVRPVGEASDVVGAKYFTLAFLQRCWQCVNMSRPLCMLSLIMDKWLRGNELTVEAAEAVGFV